MRRLLVALALAACAATVLMASGAPGVSPQAGHLYRGTTSQQDTSSSFSVAPWRRNVRFGVTADGARVVGFRIGRDFACRKGRELSGRTGTFEQVTMVLKIRADGHFSGKSSVRGGRGSEIRRGRVGVRGSFSSGGSRGRGVFRERSKLRDGTRCDSGRIRFRVRVR